MPIDLKQINFEQPDVCDLRCGCGNLLARLVSGGVELKCRRCKRTVMLPLEAGATTEVGIGSET
jgi:phage FluMu protein Com